MRARLHSAAVMGGRPVPARPRPPRLLQLQAAAGNAAVARAVAGRAALQRDVSAPDQVIDEVNRFDVVLDKQFGLGDDKTVEEVDNKTSAKHHTKESAAHRAVVLVPKALKPELRVDVVLQFHGHTGDIAGRPFPGNRVRDDGALRDRDLDRVEAQMKDSGNSQVIVVLPQGTNTSQFGKVPTEPYIDDALRIVVSKLGWQKAPDYRVVLGAHSGGGFQLRSKLNADVEADKKLTAATAKANEAGQAPPPGPAHPLAEVVIFESEGLGPVREWADYQLNKVLGVIKSKDASEQDRKDALAACPRLRAYTTTTSPTYMKTYKALAQHLNAWFATNKDALGPYFDSLRSRFQICKIAIPKDQLEPISGGSHEKAVHGVDGPAARGPLADAARVLKNTGADPDQVNVDRGEGATVDCNSEWDDKKK